MEPEDELAPFVDSHRRRNRGLAIVASLFLSVAVAVVLAPIEPLLGKLALVGLFGGVGLSLAIMAARGLTRPDEAVEVLRARPHEVVWIYPTQQIHDGGHLATTFTLQLRDGSKVATQVRPPIEDEAAKILRARCPDADYGYDPDLAAKHAAPGKGAGANAWAPALQGDAALEPLLHALTRDARGWLWFGVPSMAVAALSVVAYVQLRDPLLAGVAALFGVIGLLMLRVALRPARRHPLVETLLGDGDQVESITLRYVSYGGGNEPQLRVDTRRGKFYLVLLSPGTEKPLLAELRQRVPDAVR